VLIYVFLGVFVMKKVSAKQKMLNYLTKKSGKNTFSVEQGRTLFKVDNVSARISELRQDGYKIKSVLKKTKAGMTRVYQYGARA
jgi:biotin operon repressor